MGAALAMFWRWPEFQQDEPALRRGPIRRRPVEALRPMASEESRATRLARHVPCLAWCAGGDVLGQVIVGLLN